MQLGLGHLTVAILAKGRTRSDNGQYNIIYCRCLPVIVLCEFCDKTNQGLTKKKKKKKKNPFTGHMFLERCKNIPEKVSWG